MQCVIPWQNVKMNNLRDLLGAGMYTNMQPGKANSVGALIDAAGLTISKFVGVSMVVVGLVYLVILYKYLPERSPATVAVRPKKNANP